MKKFLFALLLFSCYITLHPGTATAQAAATPVAVSLDSSTIGSTNLLFDRPLPITLQHPAGKQIVNVSLLGINKSGCFATLKPTCVSNLFSGRKIHSLRIATKKEIQKQGLNLLPVTDTLTVKPGVFKINLPALLPGNRYFMLVTTRSRPEGMIRIVDSLFAPLPASSAMNAGRHVQQTKSIYNTIDSLQRITFSSPSASCNCDSFEFGFNEFNDFLKFLNTPIVNPDGSKTDFSQLIARLKAEEDKLETLKAGIDRSLTSQLPPLAISPVMIKALTKYSSKCIPCASLPSVNNLSDPGILLGYRSPVNLHPVSRADTGPEQRLANLDSSIFVINKLISALRLYHTEFPGSSQASTNIQALQQEKDTLERNYQVLKKHIATISSLTTRINKLRSEKESIIYSYEGFYQPSSGFYSDTYTFNFETRADNALKAEFGFLAYGSPGNKAVPRGFSPFLGFHWNLRPMDTDVPFNQIDKGIAGYLSFHSGILIGSFKEDGKRDGLVGGTAIYTGIGLAFSHAVRLHFGSVWYRKESPNPLVSKKTTAAVPYASLALDLRLKQIYESFTNIFTL
ncbi:hypothetical protein [Pararcticibacter amylolyticus]|uniref:Uncharacterized protein n=1 Tax=Pararcticibacter amylolyticus TaxID=2173175 RepID=A0A2U2PBH3_9SPHI|nr:hypothetical protein [Pararcticibacter amylolyticus]PWG78710.1 hypothetical protein DDR33_21050 [Pararcticibacter amylolyticus]